MKYGVQGQGVKGQHGQGQILKIGQFGASIDSSNWNVFKSDKYIKALRGFPSVKDEGSGHGQGVKGQGQILKILYLCFYHIDSSSSIVIFLKCSRYIKTLERCDSVNG